MSESSKSGVKIEQLFVEKKDKVAGLSDRPNQTGLYGASRLSAQELKEHFDLYSDKIAEKVNEIIDKLSNGNGDYLSIGENISLYDLVASFEDGSWAGKFQIKPPASEKTNLLAFLNGLTASISDLKNAILSVEYDNSSKSLLITLNEENVIEVSLGDIIAGLVNSSDILHTTGTSDNKVMSQKAVTDALENVDEKHINLVQVEKVIDYNTGAIIPTLKIERENGDFVGIALDDLIPSKIKQDVGKSYSNVDYETATGKLTFTSNDGETSKTIDLPLERLVKEAYYDKDSQTIFLTLDAGQPLEISLSDIVGKIIDSVGTDNIQDGAVTTAKIADNAVATNYDADGKVANSKIKKDAVYTESIRDKAVTQDKIAYDTISVDHLEEPVRGALLKSFSDVSYDKPAGALNFKNNDNKDVTVYLPTTDELEKRVETLEGLTLAKITDDTVAYEKVVPADVGTRAAINKLGGMYYKSRNLFKGKDTYVFENVSYFDLELGLLENGLYYFSYDYAPSSDNDGHVGFEIDAVLYHAPCEISVYSGSGSKYVTVKVASEDRVGAEPYRNLNGTIKNIMLCHADEEDKSYEPYFEGYVKPTSIESRGANFWLPLESQTLSGVTLAADDNGIYTLNGTATSSANFLVKRNLKAGTYTLCDYAEGSFPANGYPRTAVFVEGESSTTLLTIANEKAGNTVSTTTLSQDSEVSLRIRVHAGHTYNNCILKPMLNYGTEAVPYKPFSEAPIDTFEIPEAIRNLPGYGIGKSATECNYIDFDRKVFVDGYELVAGVVQKKESATETPISEYLPSYKKYFYMDVEPGGTLKFINDGSNDVPSTVTYVKKL